MHIRSSCPKDAVWLLLTSSPCANHSPKTSLHHKQLPLPVMFSPSRPSLICILMIPLAWAQMLPPSGSLDLGPCQKHPSSILAREARMR